MLTNDYASDHHKNGDPLYKALNLIYKNNSLDQFLFTIVYGILHKTIYCKAGP